LPGCWDLALVPSLLFAPPGRPSPAAADQRDRGDTGSIWISSGSSSASARGLARQSQADLPDILPGGPQPASEASPAPCHGQPANGAAGRRASERLLEHGFCGRQSLQRPSLPGLNDSR